MCRRVFTRVNAHAVSSVRVLPVWNVERGEDGRGHAQAGPPLVVCPQDRLGLECLLVPKSTHLTGPQLLTHESSSFC